MYTDSNEKITYLEQRLLELDEKMESDPENKFIYTMAREKTFQKLNKLKSQKLFNSFLK